ncbi:hypothetical protein ACFQNE_14400 [Gordonia phosphorivorans]|uniref:HNH endonuclease n=1 Tax=Gordonia phosphorivorans TaxID=1056982 RepID=A0ABV6HEJ3_9ACTN
MTGPDSTPSPAALAARAARATAPPPDPADHPVAGQVDGLLTQVEQIRSELDGAFRLAAVARQAELLTAAHDALVSALDEVGRG